MAGRLRNDSSSLADCGLSAEECENVILIKQILFGVTISFDVITLIVIVILRKYLKLGQRILVYILISNLGEALSAIVNNGHPSTNCAVIGFFLQAFGFAEFMWVGGLTVFLVNLLNVKEEDKRVKERTYIAACWIFPFFWGLLPATTLDYGSAGVFCWIKNTHPWGHAWRFVVYWIPVIIGMVVIFITIAVLHYKASKKFIYNPSTIHQQKQHTKSVKKYLRPLTAYATAFLIVNTVMFIERVQNILGDPIVGLRYMHTIAYPSYGIILCSLFYIMNRRKDLTLGELRKSLAAHRNDCSCRKSSGRIVTFKLPTAVSNILTEVFNPRFSQGRSANQNIREQEHGDSDKSGWENGDSKSCQTESIPKYSNHGYVSSNMGELSIKDAEETGDASEEFSLNELNIPFNDELILGSLHEPRKNHYFMGSARLFDVPDTGLSNDKPPDVIPPVNVPLDIRDLEIRAAGARLPDIRLPENQYTMKQNNGLLKIRVSTTEVRWEKWEESETVQMWVTRQLVNLREGSDIVIQDQDGVTFGKNVTWTEIKMACTTVRIIVNSFVNEIEL